MGCLWSQHWCVNAGGQFNSPPEGYDAVRLKAGGVPNLFNQAAHDPGLRLGWDIESAAERLGGWKRMIKHRGLRHLALNVADVATATAFYQQVFGMRVVWQPDADNAYLSSGCDSLALHRGSSGEKACARIQSGPQVLDHLGFIVPTVQELEAGYQWAQQNQLDIARPLRRHRDGSISYYLRDPDGNIIQLLYEPSISSLNIRGAESSD